MAEQAQDKPKRGRGAPSGKANGNYKHGRYSRVERAERLRKANANWRPLRLSDRLWLDER